MYIIEFFVFHISGETEKNVVKIFRTAAKKQPTVIFLDEVDFILSSSQNEVVGDTNHQIIGIFLDQVNI